jgi:prolyl 4-hydroxylase
LKRIDISNDINFIGSWNINDDELCKNIVKIFEENTLLHQKGQTSYGIDEKVKKSTDIGIDPIDLNKKEFGNIKLYFKKLYDCYQDYKKQWPCLKKNLETVDIPTFNIQKYEIGGHFARMHCEREGVPSMHRVFAWMTYLNDVEDGGETFFEHYNLKIKPEIGKTLIWPAEWTHSHRGEVLNKGLKYIITGWMHFPFNFQVKNS